MILNADKLIEQANALGASDIHVVCGLPVRVRINGSLRDFNDEPMTAEDCESFAKELAGTAYQRVAEIGEVDVAATYAGNIRVRMNIFRQQGSISAAIRILRRDVPSMKELGLPPVVATFPELRSGLVLVTGDTGSGKSTTLASILNVINHTRRDHIITLEDPVEYIYQPDLCIVNQREVGTDTRSYTDGLHSLLREDPDVILIGEMRDLNTISTALTAAETGHLVLATLHTNSAAETVDRIINSYPEMQQHQIRLQLASTLRVVLAQQLLANKTDSGRVLACEVMVVNDAIRNLIRESRTAQIESFIALNARSGCMTMDTALFNLYRDGKISYESALLHARDRERFEKLK